MTLKYINYSVDMYGTSAITTNTYQTVFTGDEDSVQLKFSITDEEDLTGATALIHLYFGDSSHFERTCTPITGGFQYTLTGTENDHAGVTRVDIYITKAGAKFTRAGYKFRIDKSLEASAPLVEYAVETVDTVVKEAGDWLLQAQTDFGTAQDTRAAEWVTDNDTRADEFTAAQTSRATTFGESEASRASTFNTNETGRSNTFTTNENARQAAAEANQAQAATDHTTAEADHDIAIADSSMASSDHATATTDHSTAVIDHSTASADHTTALADQEIVDGLQDQFNDVIANATVDSEVINARQGSATLSQNILSIKGQLAETQTQVDGIDRGYGGTYPTLAALQAAFPTGDTKRFVVAGSTGIKEVDALTVNTAVTNTGVVTITLNGVAKNVSVDSTTDTTTDAVATKIRATAFTGWTTGGTGSLVTFTKTTTGINSTPTFNGGASGVTGSFAVTLTGENARTGDWYYWSGSAWNNGGVFQATGIGKGAVSIQGTDFVDIGLNLFNTNSDEITEGYYINSDGQVLAASTLFVSEPIPALSGDKFVVPVVANILITKMGGYYNSIGQFIAAVTATESNGVRTITVPSNSDIAEMRVNGRNNTTTLYRDTFMIISGTTYPSEYIPYVYPKLSNIFALNDRQKEEIGLSGNPLTGKVGAYLGDSIGAGAGEVVRIAWAGRISSNNNMPYTNYSVSGATVAAETYSGETPRTWLCRKVANMRADADYIILQGGFNDHLNNVALGVITADYVTAFDETTFCGGFESLLKQCIEKYVGKKIGYIVTYKVENEYYPYGTTSTASEVYFEKAKEICEKWSVPYLDLYNQSGIAVEVPSIKAAFIPDGIHVNEAGYEIITPKIEAWLKTL